MFQKGEKKLEIKSHQKFSSTIQLLQRTSSCTFLYFPRKKYSSNFTHFDNSLRDAFYFIILHDMTDYQYIALILALKKAKSPAFLT